MKKFCLVFLVLIFVPTILSGVACSSQSRPTASQVASEIIVAAQEVQKGNLVISVSSLISEKLTLETFIPKEIRPYISPKAITSARVEISDGLEINTSKKVELEEGQGYVSFEGLLVGRYTIIVSAPSGFAGPDIYELQMRGIVEIEEGSNTAVVSWHSTPIGFIFMYLKGSPYFDSVPIKDIQILIDKIVGDYQVHPILIDPVTIAESIIKNQGKVPTLSKNFIASENVKILIKGLPKGEKVSAFLSSDPVSPKLTDLGNGEYIFEPAPSTAVSHYLNILDKENKCLLCGAAVYAGYYEADLSSYFPQDPEVGLMIDFGPEGKVLVAPEVEIIHHDPIITTSVGQGVRFAARATDDGTITSVTWRLGDGSVKEGEQGLTENTFFVEYIYKNPGWHLLEIEVTDNDGLSASDSIYVWVREE